MYESNPLPFFTPCNLALVAPTQGGKTQLMAELLNNMDYYFSPAPKKILYCYSEWQDKFDEMQKTVPDIEFHQGLPNSDFLDDWSLDKEGSMICMDDLMTEVCSCQESVTLLTVKTHHRNITTVMLNQSLYPVGKYARTLSLNLNYILLFRILRDTLQLKTFGSQMFPGKPYGFLCIDSHPKSEKKYQLWSTFCWMSSDQPK